MPGALTYTAIALLVRDRLGQMRDQLEARKRAGIPNAAIERRVLFLAKVAHEIVSAGAPVPPPVRVYGPPLGDQVSRFFFAGAVGPEFTAFAAFHAPGQQWLRDTIHKGSPDSNRELVVANSTQFVMELLRLSQVAIGRISDTNKQLDAKTKISAYILGHCCHIAADVVSAPYLDAVSALPAEPNLPPISRDNVINILETEVATRVFNHPGVRDDGWGDWFPARGDFPDFFFDTYKDALESAYGAGAQQRGFPEFNEQFTSNHPPSLSVALLRDGYSTFRTITQIGKAWDFWDWVGATAFVFVPFSLIFPFAAVLPKGQDYFRSTRPANYDEGTGLFEVLTYPFAVTSFVGLILSIVTIRSYVGAGVATIYGLTSSIVQIILAVVFFATLGSGGAAKVIFLLITPIVLEGINIFLVFRQGRGDYKHNLLAAASILRLSMSTIFLLCYWGFLHFGVEDWYDPEGSNGVFWGLTALWFGISIGLWAAAAGLIRKFFTGRVPIGPADTQHVTTGRHLRVFDDTTLFDESPAPSPNLAQLEYPSGKRKLLKIWWEADHPPKFLSRRDHLDFDFGGGRVVTIGAPVAATTSAEFAAFLERNVKNAAGDAKLKARIAFTDDPQYTLPAGFVFSDHNDDPDTSDAPADLPVHEEQATLVFHAPKTVNSVRYTATGPSDIQPGRAAQVNGDGTLNVTANSRVATTAPGSTPLTQLFRPGDKLIFHDPAGNVTRVVMSVDSDTRLTVSLAFPNTANAAFTRDISTRGGTFVPPPAWTVTGTAQNNTLAGTGGDFGLEFMPGDVISIQVGGVFVNRLVIFVENSTTLIISLPINTGGAVAFQRPAGQPDLLPYLSTTDDNLQAGGSILNHAVDFGVLLCLGAASRLVPDLDAPLIPNPPLNPVVQVFRNWNLDRRRENEWRTIVIGNAVSEKRGNVDGPDATLSSLPPNYRILSPGGEAVSRQMGWLPLLRAWMDLASHHPGGNLDPQLDTASDVALRPGNPSNLSLSQGLAYLLDMADPAHH